ncbi:MAG: tandem-95 repeat protein [bacterium]|nr:tandem-95 repeat protein [bacterium]
MRNAIETKNLLKQGRIQGLPMFVCLLLLCLSGVEIIAQSPNDAGLKVEVFVDNSGNSGSPKQPADFHFGVAQAGSPPRFIFFGKSDGTVVPIDGGDSEPFFVQLTQTHEGYVPVFEGDCNPDGSVLVGRGQIKECRVTMFFLSFSDRSVDQTVLKVVSQIDNTDSDSRNPPTPEAFTIRLFRPGGVFEAQFQGSQEGVNIGISTGVFFEVASLQNSTFPAYLPSYEGCTPNEISGRFSVCTVTHSFLNRVIDTSPDAIINLKTTIERYSPSAARPPVPEDFPINLISGNNRLAVVRANANGFNVGLRQFARKVSISIEVENPGFLDYLPVVTCSDTNLPFVNVAARRKKYCEVKVYYVDDILDEPAEKILKVSKEIVNGGLPNETADESEFRMNIVDPAFTGSDPLASFDGSESGVFFGLPSSGRFEPVERENFSNYFPLYSPDCSAFSTRRFRECLITNYSIRFREQRANMVLRVVTSIESFDPRGGPMPTTANFRVRVLAGGQLLDSFLSSEVGSNLAITDVPGREISIEVSGAPEFDGYLPTLSEECKFIGAGADRLMNCEIKIYYLDADDGSDSNAAYRITKRLVQPNSDSRISESSFTLGVFRSGEDTPFLTVPGSSSGVVTGVKLTVANSSVREVNVPAGYVALYSPGCSAGQLRIGGIQECVVTNVYVGAVPPKADFQRVSVGEDGSKAFRLTGNDPDSPVLNFQLTSQPSNGTLSGVAPDLIYTPHANYHGTDSFTFRVNDGQFFSEIQTIPIDVSPVNDIPVATARTASAITKTATQIQLFATDIDGDAVTASLVSAPANGEVTISGLFATYTSRSDFVGQDTFTYRVFDGTAFSGAATVTVTVGNGIAVNSVSRTELNSGINQFTFSVELLAPTQSNVSVSYATANITALAGNDYTSRSGTITFVRGGPLVVPITISVLGEQLFEQNETFRLNLSNAVGATLRNSFGIGTIINDDIQVGIASMAPTELTVDVGEPFSIDLTWVHPERWRLLDEIEFRIVDDEVTAMWVKFEENGTTLPFRQYNVNSRNYGDPVLPGTAIIFDTNLAKMFVADSLVLGSGPTGPRATVRPSLSFKPKAAGRVFRVELFVRDDLGNLQGFDQVGTIAVLPR